MNDGAGSLRGIASGYHYVRLRRPSGSSMACLVWDLRGT